MILVPKWTEPRKRKSRLGSDPTVQEIDAEIRRLKKLKEDSERETERWLREMNAREKGERS